MTAARWQRLRNILADALECKSERERREFVTVSCRHDANLKAELDALLAQHDHAWWDEPFLLERRSALLGAFVPTRENGTADTPKTFSEFF